MPEIIGISGVSGSGKTTLTETLSQSMACTAIYWDDFDTISTGPSDYVGWYQQGQNYNAWDYPKLKETLHQLKSNINTIHPALNISLPATEIIVFDSPMGKLHSQTGKYIDLWIHLTVPLDVALIRRTLRDCKMTDITKEELLENLDYYLKSARPLFFDEIYKQKADLIVDGTLPLQTQVSTVMNRIHNQATT